MDKLELLIKQGNQLSFTYKDNEFKVRLWADGKQEGTAANLDDAITNLCVYLAESMKSSLNELETLLDKG